MTHRFSVAPFLLAFLMGIASMPLGVYDVHARELGAVDVGHRTPAAASSLAASARPAASQLLTRLRAWSATVVGDETGLIATELLAPVAGIKALKQRAADLVGAMKAVQTKLGDAKLAADAPERAELKADMTKLLDMTEANASDLKDAERLANFERNLSPVADPDADAARRAAAAGHIDVRDRVEDDPKFGFKDKNDYFKALMAASGGRVDKRLMPLRATQGSDEQGEYSDPYGNFLLPVTLLPGVMSVSADDDPIAPLVTSFPMRTPAVKINARVDKNHSSSVSGGLVVTRRPETVDGTSSRMKFEQVGFNANELFGFTFATESILNDSPESFFALLNAGFRDEFAGKAIDERLNGSGVGEFEGVINAPCTVEVAKETGQAADTIVTANVEKMSARSWRYRRAVWIANATTKVQLMALVRSVGTGGAPIPYFRSAEGEGGVDSLLGRPIYFTEFAKALGDKGDLILANWSEYLEGTLQTLQQAESIHVRFLANERAFKFWLRNDARPWWKTPLTPKNGDTLSPFVVLAAR